MTERDESQETPSKVECPAAKDPAVRLFILAGMLLAGGLYCFIDFYVRHKYPWDPAGSFNDKLTSLFNSIGGIVMPLAALVPLIWGIVFLRRKVVADEEGIGYVGREKIAWDDVTTLDTSKLPDKGILRLRYDRAGEKGQLVLDGWKLQNFKELMQLIEMKVPAVSEQ